MIEKYPKSGFKKGLSLVEVIISVAVVGIILIGVVKTVVVSLKNSEFSRNKSLSLNLAQSKLEEIRKDRDTQNWTVFWNLYFLGGSTTRTYPPEEGLNGIFTRNVELSGDDEKTKMSIIVKVSWSDSEGTHVTSVSNYLTKWR